MASTILQLLFALVYYIIGGPVRLLIILFNEGVRLGVAIFLYLKYDGEVFLVGDGTEGIWATQSDRRTRMVVMGVRFKGQLKEETLLRIYNEKIRGDKDESGNLLNDKLERILTSEMGYACWENDINFDIRNHVKFLSDKVLNKKGLEKLIEELSRDMAPSKPQWEWIIVPRYAEGKDETETGWFLCRFNHAYGDGLSILMFLKRYIFPDFTYFIDPIKFNIPFEKKILFYLNTILFGPYLTLEFFMNKSKEYWQRQSNTATRRSFRWTESINLEKIKLIRKAAGNTTTSAVVENAFISAAIQVLPSKRIPNEWVIGEMAAMLPYPDEKLTNRFAAFRYSINSLNDEWTNLIESKKAAWEGMTGPGILVSYKGFKVMGRMPLRFHKKILDGSAATFMFSNVPMSRTNVVGVDGIEAVEFIGFPPQANDTGITLLCTTYVNSVQITASAKADWLSEDELEAIVNGIPKIIEDWAKTAEKIEI